MVTTLAKGNLDVDSTLDSWSILTVGLPFLKSPMVRHPGTEDWGKFIVHWMHWQKTQHISGAVTILSNTLICLHSPDWSASLWSTSADGRYGEKRLTTLQIWIKKNDQKLFLTSNTHQKLYSNIICCGFPCGAKPVQEASAVTTLLWEGIDPRGTLVKKKQLVSMESRLLCTRYICVSQGPGASHAAMSGPFKDGLRKAEILC